jgi:glycosyltransferase involved in cell wall biosynthesis
MNPTIGYLVAEFPGQTHMFFWRELQALADAGVETDLVSTRRPASALISHSWAGEAMARTAYLASPGWRALLGGCATLLGAGPAAWWRCLRAVATGSGSLLGKVRRLLLVPFAAELAWLAGKRGWQRVHVHSCGNAADVALFARLLTGLRYSLTLHALIKEYGPNQRQKWRSADFAIVITRTLLEAVRRELAGDLPPRVEVAPMGVDLRRFSRSVPYAPWERSGPCRVFTCGRLNPCKGHDELIRAVAALRESGLPVSLRIAGQDDSGSGRYREYLDRVAADSGVADHIEFLGAVSEEVVRAEIEKAHLFALASVQEALGVAIMEAMALEVPVVATRVGGVPELVEDGIDGLLAEPSDPASMASRMRRVLEDPALARRLGAEGRAKVERSFHSGVSAGVMTALLADSRPHAVPAGRHRAAERVAG